MGKSKKSQSKGQALAQARAKAQLLAQAKQHSAIAPHSNEQAAEQIHVPASAKPDVLATAKVNDLENAQTQAQANAQANDQANAQTQSQADAQANDQIQGQAQGQPNTQAGENGQSPAPSTNQPVAQPDFKDKGFANHLQVPYKTKYIYSICQYDIGSAALIHGEASNQTTEVVQANQATLATHSAATQTLPVSNEKSNQALKAQEAQAFKVAAQKVAQEAQEETHEDGYWVALFQDSDGSSQQQNALSEQAFHGQHLVSLVEHILKANGFQLDKLSAQVKSTTETADVANAENTEADKVAENDTEFLAVAQDKQCRVYVLVQQTKLQNDVFAKAQAGLLHTQAQYALVVANQGLENLDAQQVARNFFKIRIWTQVELKEQIGKIKAHKKICV